MLSVNTLVAVKLRVERPGSVKILKLCIQQILKYVPWCQFWNPCLAPQGQAHPETCASRLMKVWRSEISVMRPVDLKFLPNRCAPGLFAQLLLNIRQQNARDFLSNTTFGIHQVSTLRYLIGSQTACRRTWLDLQQASMGHKEICVGREKNVFFYASQI